MTEERQNLGDERARGFISKGKKPAKKKKHQVSEF
jgi:hypothetical protein